MRRRRLLLAAWSFALAGCPATEDDDGERLDASGTIEVVIDGEPLDLTRDRFVAEHAEDSSIAFHLHEGSEEWFMEGRERVTFAEGLDLLPHVSHERVDAQDVLTVDGTTYDEREGTDIGFTVDGEPVDPATYEVRGGDALRVEIATGG